MIAGLVLCLSTVTGCGGGGTSGSRVEATVTRVVDGDTLVVDGDVRVRLVQIDAPEAGEECHATSSARELARLAPPGATVVLEADARLDDVDAFGRLLRYVRAGGQSVNVELVRRGAATPWFYRGERGRYAARLLAAVRAASSRGRGLWAACRVSWHPDRALETRPR